MLLARVGHIDFFSFKFIKNIELTSIVNRYRLAKFQIITVLNITEVGQ